MCDNIIPNLGCEGEYDKRGTNAIYFCSKVLKQQRQKTTKYLPVSLFQTNWTVFFTLSCQENVMQYFRSLESHALF